MIKAGVFLLPFLFNLAFAQAQVFLFSGKIGKGRASMRLEITNSSGVAKGIYFYHQYKIPIDLSGQKGTGPELILKSSDGEQFNGKLLGGKFSGDWYKGIKGKHLSFSFSPITEVVFERAICFKNIKGHAMKNCDRFNSKNKAESILMSKEFPDLDGDGTQETLFACAIKCGATGNCEYELYLSNHGCFRWAGRIDGNPRTPALKSQHNGLSDISSFWNSGCAGQEGVYNEYQFDGNQYKVTKSVNCQCEEARDKPRPLECL